VLTCVPLQAAAGGPTAAAAAVPGLTRSGRGSSQAGAAAPLSGQQPFMLASKAHGAGTIPEVASLKLGGGASEGGTLSRCSAHALASHAASTVALRQQEGGLFALKQDAGQLFWFGSPALLIQVCGDAWLWRGTCKGHAHMARLRPCNPTIIESAATKAGRSWPALSAGLPPPSSSHKPLNLPARPPYGAAHAAGVPAGLLPQLLPLHALRVCLLAEA
jgi:hypothetical protein